jgi:hypothetical protein
MVRMFYQKNWTMLISFSFINGQNWLQKQSSHVIFFKGCHNYPQNKTLPIVYITFEHWIYHNFSCRHGCI